MARVTILFDALRGAALDEADNAREVAEVGAALKRLGHEVRELAVGPDLAALAGESAASLGTAFNLMEGLGGCFYIYTAAAQFLEWRGVPFTGATGDQLLALSNKLLLRRMLTAGIEMPALAEQTAGKTFIVKSVREHASLGIDADSIVARGDLEVAIERRHARFGGAWFAEEFIPGREFCIGVLLCGASCEILAPTEILFTDVPAGTPHILDYRSKWDEASVAYGRTPRQLVDMCAEPDLYRRLVDTSRTLWQGLGLASYARFDFRLAATGELYLIDLNLNPCLSQNAGLTAMAEASGIAYDMLIARILAAAGTLAVKPSEPAATSKAQDDARPTMRDYVEAQDGARVRALVEATAFFSPQEADIAVELVDARVRRGRASGYEFVLLERAGELMGYACFGPTPGTDATFDLYWIVVAPPHQRGGWGRRLLECVETRIRRAGGRQIFVDTASTDRYAPTRGFYESSGFKEAARLADFYRPGDGKIIYVKQLFSIA